MQGSTSPTSSLPLVCTYCKKQCSEDLCCHLKEESDEEKARVMCQRCCLVELTFFATGNGYYPGCELSYPNLCEFGPESTNWLLNKISKYVREYPVQELGEMCYRMVNKPSDQK